MGSKCFKDKYQSSFKNSGRNHCHRLWTNGQKAVFRLRRKYFWKSLSSADVVRILMSDASSNGDNLDAFVFRKFNIYCGFPERTTFPSVMCFLGTVHVFYGQSSGAKSIDYFDHEGYRFSQMDSY